MLDCSLGELVNTTGNETTILGDEGTEDERADSGKLDKDVDGRAGGVLERVTDGVASDGGSLDLLEVRGLLGDEDGLIAGTLDLNSKALGLNDLLGVVPSTTGVGGREGNLDTRDDAASKDTVGGLEAEEVAGKEGREDDEEAGGNHLLEGSVGGDGDAGLVVGLVATLDLVDVGLTAGDLLHLSELGLDVAQHLLGGITDSLHGEGREPVGEHGTEEETSEGEGLEDVDAVGLLGNKGVVLHLTNGGSDAGNEGTEKGEGDEGSGANGETLADSGGGVASSIEGISVLADAGVKVGHLRDATSVVSNGAIAINGEGNGEAAEHANGGKSDTVHGSDVVGDEDGDGEADDGDDSGEVAKGEAVDDLRGGAVDARLGELVSGGAIAGTSVVLSDEANEETGPEAEDDASISLPWGGVVGLASEVEGEVLREHPDGRDDSTAHEDGGNPELDLESEVSVEHLLTLLLGHESDVSEELADEGSNDANSSDDEGEVGSIGSLDNALGAGGDDESGAGGLSERAEKISTHTGDVTNVVTDVVSNGARVKRRVLREILADLTSEISTNISSLGVDTTTDSAEEGDGGATETVARDELEDVGSLLPGTEASGSNGSGVGEDDDLEDEESEADKDETEDLAALEGNLEALEPIDVAKVGGLDIAGSSDHHANISAGHGGGGADEEGNGGVGEGVSAGGPRHVDGTEDNDTEEGTEDGKSAVLFLKEGDGTLRIIIFKLASEGKKYKEKRVRQDIFGCLNLIEYLSHTYILNVLVDSLHELLAALLSSRLLEAELLHELVGLNLFAAEPDFLGVNFDFAHLEQSAMIRISSAIAGAV